MTKVTQNIDLVQINLVPGVREYFLPKNSDWKDRVIDKIALVCSDSGYAPLISPIDGTTIMTGANVRDCYLDVYSEDEKLLVNGLAMTSILFTNNYPHEIKSAISLDLTRFYFATDPDIPEGESRCVLLYVYYGGKEILDPEPSRKNVSVQVKLSAGQRMSFREIIDAYIHVDNRKVRSATVWRFAENSPVFLTLRDKQLRYIFDNIYSDLFRPCYDSKTNPDPVAPTGARSVSDIFPEDLDIDFEYSYVQNASSTTDTTVVITFEYN